MLRRLLPLPLLLACHAPARDEVAFASPVPTTAGPRTVAILVYEGVELLDFSGPGEVFSAARGPGGRAFRVVTVAKTKDPVVSQGFVRITPEHSIADCPTPDIVVVPGGNVPDQDAELQEWVRRCAAKSELVMSVCNGAFLLAETGLLDGLEVTTHHGSLEGLSANFPKVKVFTNRRFVDSGRVMTCAGVSAGIDGALHVVERLIGPEAAKSTASYMEYDWRPDEIAKQHAEPGKKVVEGPGVKLGATVARSGLDAGMAEYRKLSPQPDESQLNRDAYGLLWSGKKAEARGLLELVVALFPESANAHDSLAEACEALGDTAAALREAETALAKLQAHPGEPERDRALRNVAASRVVRMGNGDKSALRFACAPCGGSCDKVRLLEGGACPLCRMELVDVGAESP